MPSAICPEREQNCIRRVDMLSLDCFAPLRIKFNSEGIIAGVRSRKVGKASLSSFLFLCPKTVSNKSGFFVCCTLNFLDRDCIQLMLQTEMLSMGLLRIVSMICIWDGTISD